MTHAFWPLFDLKLTTPDLVLRPLSEADLAELVEVVPDDLELDPDAPRYAGLDERRERQVICAQTYWRAVGTWKPQSWKLVFGIRQDTRLIGSQALEGDDFPRLRTVDSWSYLAEDARGRGWGKQMRRAVLTLAFGHLGADSAVTSAWQDNVASLGVSRSLGYVDNGVERHRRDDGADTMVHLRLSRAAWEESGNATDVSVSGFEPCRPLFAL